MYADRHISPVLMLVYPDHRISPVLMLVYVDRHISPFEGSPRAGAAEYVHRGDIFQKDDRRYLPPPWEGVRGMTPI